MTNVRTSSLSDQSPMTLARLAGFFYLIIIVCATSAEMGIRSSIVVAGDAEATVTNIVGSEGLYRLALGLDLVAFAAGGFLAVTLYFLLKPVSPVLSLMAAGFELIEVTMNGLNQLNHIMPLLLLGDGDYLAPFDASEISALVMLFLRGHTYGYLTSFIFFGVHILLIAWLFYTSRMIPRVIAVLLFAAGTCYVFGTLGVFLFPDYSGIIMPPVFLFAIAGEWSLCLWLLIKGVKAPAT